MKTLEEWRKEIHALACEKGWWDQAPDVSPTSILAKLALVISELSEAIELVREPDFDPKAVWMTGLQGSRISYSVNPWSTKPVPKPEGFGTEIADAVIRILDLMGALELEFVAKEDFLEKLKLKFERPEALKADDILAVIMRVSSMLGRAADVADNDNHSPASWDAENRDLFRGWLTSAIVTVCALGARMGVDIEARIAEKHAYNVTREIRHGGKRA